MSAPGRTTPGFSRSGFSMGARFLLLAIVCIALMLLDRRDQHLVRVRQALSVVVYPVRVRRRSAVQHVGNDERHVRRA